MRTIIVVLLAVCCFAAVSCKDKDVKVYTLREVVHEKPVMGDDGTVRVKIRDGSTEFKIVTKCDIFQIYRCEGGVMIENGVDSVVSSVDTLVRLDYGGGSSRWVTREEKAQIDEDIRESDHIAVDTIRTGDGRWSVVYRWTDN